MKKLIFVFFAAIIVVTLFFNAGGGGLSNMETALNETKIQRTISEVNGALDVVGDKRFYNMNIDSKYFNGVVEQPASNFSGYVKEYKITDKEVSGQDTILGFANADYEIKLTVEGDDGADEAVMKDNSLPAEVVATEKVVSAEPLLKRGVGKGIRPIMKGDETNSKEWIEEFLFSNRGLALKRLTQYEDEWKKLEDTSAQVKFLEWMLGASKDSEPEEWEAYKSDRLCAMREINVEALTGIEKNRQALALIDPNRVTLYEVVYVNTSTFKNLPKEMGLSLEVDENQFIYDVASHINQVIGGKTLIIPHNDKYIVRYEDEPLFLLN